MRLIDADKLSESIRRWQADGEDPQYEEAIQDCLAYISAAHMVDNQSAAR